MSNKKKSFEAFDARTAAPGEYRVKNGYVIGVVKKTNPTTFRLYETGYTPYGEKRLGSQDYLTCRDFVQITKIDLSKHPFAPGWVGISLTSDGNSFTFWESPEVLKNVFEKETKETK